MTSFLARVPDDRAGKHIQSIRIGFIHAMENWRRSKTLLESFPTLRTLQLCFHVDTVSQLIAQLDEKEVGSDTKWIFQLPKPQEVSLRCYEIVYSEEELEGASDYDNAPPMQLFEASGKASKAKVAMNLWHIRILGRWKVLPKVCTSVDVKSWS